MGGNLQLGTTWIKPSNWTCLTFGTNPFINPSISWTEIIVYFLNSVVRLFFMVALGATSLAPFEKMIALIPCVGCGLTAVNYVFTCWNSNHNNEGGVFYNAIPRQFIHRLFVLVAATVYVLSFICTSYTDALQKRWGKPKFYLGEYTFGLMIVSSIALEGSKITTPRNLLEIASSMLFYITQFISLWMALVQRPIPSYMRITSGVMVCLGLLASLTKLDYHVQPVRGPDVNDEMDVEINQPSTRSIGAESEETVEMNHDSTGSIGSNSGAGAKSTFSNLLREKANAFGLIFSQFVLGWRLHRVVSIISLIIHIAAYYYINLKKELEKTLGTGSYTLIEFTVAHLIVASLMLERPKVKSIFGILACVTCALHFGLCLTIVWLVTFEVEIPNVIELIASGIVLLAFGLGYIGFIIEGVDQKDD